MLAPLGIDPQFFSLVIVPILIFFARVTDVTMDTIRIIFIAKGYKFRAAFLGFFEVIIWLLAITQIMQNLTNIFCYLAYGAGFATGNYLGMLIEEKFPVEKSNFASSAKNKIYQFFNGLSAMIGPKPVQRYNRRRWMRKAR
jgi:uncharacterized protein YebE (UPF0316 family)